MLPITRYPPSSQWKSLLQRPDHARPDLQKQVGTILAAIQKDGDKALRKYTSRFDGKRLSSFHVSEAEWTAADTISPRLKKAIATAIDNIHRFHRAQIPQEYVVETMPGVRCSSRPVPVEKVGLYIPGGSAPLFSSLLMLGIPAKLAGCPEIILCTPPDEQGNIAPPILYAARALGIGKVFKAGGAQAIAAMAYGTESIPQAYKLFGPGNAYVTCAKMMLQAAGIAIDMPAGPSEVAILADDTCIPAFVAADLLSQAEHGPDSQVLLVSDNPGILNEINTQLAAQLEKLPRSAIAAKSLGHSRAILTASLSEGLALINQYAPEHLILACARPEVLAEKITSAGSVFLGNYTPESVGDYASGTNHTLPTNGYARAYSGISVSSFMKRISFQQLTPEGLAALAPAVTEMARAEGLEAHARAVDIRLNKQKT